MMTSVNSVLDIGLLKTAVPYIRAYKGKVFVVKLGGEICSNETALDNIIEQLSLLYQVGIKIVLVHGSGPQATELAERLGIESPKINGRRITSAAMLEVAKMTFNGTVNTNLVAAFRKHHTPAAGLSGVDGNLITAVKRPLTQLVDQATGETKNVDFGFVGDIVEINTEVLSQLLAGDYIPVVCSLAADVDGQVLNINADTVASALARAIKAEKYVLLSNVDGVMSDVKNPDSLCSQLTIAEIGQLVRDGSIGGGMMPKVQACIDALEGGIARAHIVNGLTPDSLLKEIFTNEGCGTLLLTDS
ncbi:MAG: acetylglutamate kinase [Bdellovibrionales bacterium]|nr:acetylglutamate kinase [Bdellovibrionales bacterium]